VTGLPRERVYSTVVGTLGWLYLVILAVFGQLHSPLMLLVFMAFAALAEIWPARLRVGTVSILTAFLIPAIALIGPADTSLALAVGSFTAGMVQRRPLSIAMFNGAQYAIAVGVAGVLTKAFGLPIVGGLHMLPLAVYYVLFLLFNHALVDSYFLLAGFSWRTAALDGIGLDLLQSVVTVPLGFGVVLAYAAYGWPGVFAVGTPLILLGYAFNLQISLRQRNRNLEVLYEFHGKFARAADGPAILQELRQSLAAVYGNTSSFAAMCDARNGLQPPLPGSNLVPYLEILETVRSSGREIILDSSRLAKQLSPSAQSGVIYPIMVRNNCYAIIALAWPFQLHIDTEDKHLFRAAVQLASIACEKEVLLRETERLAATDPRLPGLYNYRYLIARLEEEVARNARDGSRLAIVYIDLDGFKQCNDRFGHLAGDEALREFANLLGAQTRSQDVAARYAGDEFVLLLPDASADLALNVAVRLREETENFRFVPISFSFGVAMDEGGTRTARELIDDADRAMYKDKSRGRQGLQR
jgi:two-component system cell cycle response regulator